ncbi:MAG: TRAP transporter large permease subunit [Chloroflexi bacterium]|nr:TRAP transporter large permease subunit [Chloroflexota bacterium]MBI4507872.1 TRAP transporter large permease subunit [Chloroflexota bacterium]
MAHADEATVIPAHYEEESLAAPGLGTAPTWARPLVLLSDGLDRLTQVGYVAATATFASVMLLGVFFRYALNNSLSWSDELALVIFAWAVFLSTASAYLHDKHVKLELILHRLPPNVQKRWQVGIDGLSGGFLISLVFSGLQALEVAARAHTDALQWPMTIPYTAIPAASLIMFVHWLRRVSEGWTSVGGVLRLAIALVFFVIVVLPFGQYVQLAGAPRFVLLASMLLFPMFLGVPVAFALGLMATTYVATFGTIPFNTGALQIFFGVENLTLMAIPLLILAGSIMHTVGIAETLVDFAQSLVGRLRGGLAASNVVASFIFGDISGSAVSDTAAIGAIMIPQMKARGYNAAFCAALQGAAGTMGMLAPLSITVLLYATAINVSVSRLAAATFVPLIFTAVSFGIVAYVHSRRHGYPRETVPLRLLPMRTLRAIPGLFAAVLVAGGIIGGIFTPAEVGTILLFYVLFLAALMYRTANLQRLFRTTVQAGYISGMTLFMVATSAFMGFVLARDLVGILLAESIQGVTTNRFLILYIVNAIFIVLGMGLEAPAMIFGFLPSFIPLLQAAGVDPVHWGVIFVINMGLGMIIPPVALNLFISTQLAGVRFEQAVRACLPFIAIMFIDQLIIILIPQIPLFLPNLIFEYPMPKYFGIW